MSCSCGLLSLRSAGASLNGRDNCAPRIIWPFRIRSSKEQDYDIKNEKTSFQYMTPIYVWIYVYQLIILDLA